MIPLRVLLCIGRATQGKHKSCDNHYDGDRSEASSAYLMAWKSEINAVDMNGLAPLHLAVKAAEEIKSTRTVRLLMIKGADRKVKDMGGKTGMNHFVC